jgi:phage host-nuclease inhibitor protein Gam
MAAPANKPVGYQVSVIMLSLIVVILGTLIYMQVKQDREKQATYAKSEKDRQNVEIALKKRDDEFEDFAKLTGNGTATSDYGLGDDNITKVRGACLADIDKADVPAERTYKAAINKLVQQASDLRQDREKIRLDLEALQKNLLDLQRQYDVQVKTQNDGRTKAEGDLSVVIKNKDEEVRAKQKRIDELTQAANEAATELENEKTAHATDIKIRDEKITKLELKNVQLSNDIDELKKTSFEVPDGFVRWVDNQNSRVWINLGEADNLPKRMTFSVYNKNHNGVARGSEDIKGAIEVTRIVDAHTAEARIIKDDLYQPITKGDPIFTPMWSPGRKENFSFVGIIDLDGDGKSDRLKLHELVAGAGATIDNEVDDNGKRIRYTKFPNEFVDHGEGVPGIDVNTKFLVIGQIPDIAQAAKDEDKERITRILEKLKQLKGEAQLQGVRIVNLNDWLSWIGYSPQRRLYVPGAEQDDYPLKAGKREAPVDKVSGQVSNAISGNKRIKPATSNNAVSPVFKK